MDVHALCLWIIEYKQAIITIFKIEVETIINKSSLSKVSYLGQFYFFNFKV
jgi:hypothetical protein